MVSLDRLACPQCNHIVTSSANFCAACGYKLSKQCSGCSGSLLFHEQYCRTCGTKSTETKQFERTVARGDSLQAAISTSGHGPSQNAFATIMFLDVKGSTSLIESLEPEVAADFLDGIHARCVRHVRRFGGRIVNFHGDGFLSIFGAPEAREDHATRALLAAVAIRDEIGQQPDGSIPVVRIGVHSGDVFTRTVKTDFASDFDLMGLTVHVAKRLEETSEDNGIHTSYATYQLARHQFDFESLGSVRLRGMTSDIPAFRVLGFRRGRDDSIRTDAGFRVVVGRELELSALSQLLDAASGGNGHAVVLLGEAGIGKSRLTQELAEMARGHDCVVLVHEEVTEGLAHSYSTILRLVRHLKAIAGLGDQLANDTLFYDRHDVLYESLDHGRDHRRAITSGDAKRKAADIADNEDVLRFEFCSALERISERKPLLLIIDDAQWVDTESLGLVFEALSQIGHLRVLLIVCARDLGAVPRFADGGNVSFLRVGPLGKEACATLFRTIIPEASWNSSLEASVTSATAGNPLFIEEIGFAVSTGRFNDDGATQILTEKGIEPSGRIRSIVLDRVNHLEGHARLFLQCAALVQFDCSQDVLAEIAGIQDRTKASKTIQALHAAGYLRRSRVGGQQLFGMRHSLLRQIVDRSITRLERRQLHGRIREVLGRTDRESFDVLAHHATLAENWEWASNDWRAAGLKALEASLYKHAATCFERALDASAHNIDYASRGPRQNEIRMLLRLCLAPMGEYRKLYFHLSQISLDETSTSAVDGKLQLLLSLSHVENICGNVRLSRAKAIQARELAEQTKQRGAYVAASYFLAQSTEFAANYAECVELSSTMLSELLKSERHERFQLTGTASVLFASLLSHAHAFQSRLAEAERQGQLAIEIAEETQRPFDLGVAYFGLGWGRLVANKLEAAMPCFEKALEHVRDQRLGLLESMIDCRLRYLKVVVGNEPIDEVKPGEVCQKAVEMPHIWCWSNLHWAMAEVHAGRLDHAARIVSDLLPLARANHYRGVSAWAYGVIADIGYRSSAPDRGATGRRARQLVEKTGLAWRFAGEEWAYSAIDGNPAAKPSARSAVLGRNQSTFRQP